MSQRAIAELTAETVEALGAARRRIAELEKANSWMALVITSAFAELPNSEAEAYLILKHAVKKLKETS